MKIKEIFGWNWKHELFILFVVLLIAVIVLTIVTYDVCGNDKLACIINFLT